MHTHIHARHPLFQLKNYFILHINHYCVLGMQSQLGRDLTCFVIVFRFLICIQRRLYWVLNKFITKTLSITDCKKKFGMHTSYWHGKLTQEHFKTEFERSILPWNKLLFWFFLQPLFWLAEFTRVWIVVPQALLLYLLSYPIFSVLSLISFVLMVCQHWE